MSELGSIGKLLFGLGVVLLLLGGTLWLVGNLGGKVPWIGRLPGDIVIERGGWMFHFPLATSILLSLLLTLILSFLWRR